jgi:hypothetical protein
MNDPICVAISSRRLLHFDYEGRPRLVEPYCHGVTRTGESLRAIQVGGQSRSAGFGFGKLWLVSRMENVRVSDRSFPADDPNYNPDDSAMLSIHCRVQR